MSEPAADIAPKARTARAAATKKPAYLLEISDDEDPEEEAESEFDDESE